MRNWLHARKVNRQTDRQTSQTGKNWRQEGTWMDYLIMVVSLGIVAGILTWAFQTNQLVEADKQEVPDLSFKTLVEAKEILDAHGFEQYVFQEQGGFRYLGFAEGWETRNPQKWVIVKQVPAAGSQASTSGAVLHFFAFEDGSLQLKREKIAVGRE